MIGCRRQLLIKCISEHVGCLWNDVMNKPHLPSKSPRQRPEIEHNMRLTENYQLNGRSNRYLSGFLVHHVSGGVVRGNTFGPGTGRIWLDDVQCSQSAVSLSGCRHRGWGIHNCGHSEDISVQCYSGGISRVHLIVSAISG